MLPNDVSNGEGRGVITTVAEGVWLDPGDVAEVDDGDDDSAEEGVMVAVRTDCALEVLALPTCRLSILPGTVGGGRGSTCI